MKTPNQIHKSAMNVNVSAKDLLNFQPRGPVTEAGLCTNINIGSSTWAPGLPAPAVCRYSNLMEDAATAEISRAQIWHWIRSPLGILDDGRKVTRELFRDLVPQELEKVRQLLGDKGLPPEISGGCQDVRGADACRRLCRVPHFASL